MSDTTNTVEVGAFEITSTEPAEDMLRVLDKSESKADEKPRVIKPIPDKPKEPDAKLSKAAAKLGQAGGRAAAEARAKVAAESAEAGAGRVEEPVGPDAGADEGAERPAGKPESDPYARVRQATAQAQQAKRERDQALAELERLRADMVRSVQPEPEPQPAQDEDAPPKPEDFEDWNEYIRADARWAARQEYRAAQEQHQAEQELRQYGEFIERTQTQFRERVAQAYQRENPPQIAEHILNLKTSLARQRHEPPTAEHVIADALYLAPNGIELMEYLSEHGDAFDYLTQLPSPEIIQWEMRRISDLLSEHPEPGRATVAGSKVQSVSRAFPPVKTVTGSPSAADPNELSDDLPFEEYAKRRNAQEARKARRY